MLRNCNPTIKSKGELWRIKKKSNSNNKNSNDEREISIIFIFIPHAKRITMKMTKTTRLLSVCCHTVQQKSYTQTQTQTHIFNSAQMANDKCFNTYFGLPKTLFFAAFLLCVAFAYLHLAENNERPKDTSK